MTTRAVIAPTLTRGLPLLRGKAARHILNVALESIAALAVMVYLAQSWRLTPSDADDGMILDYIHQMSNGLKPHFDMADAYGPVNWLGPVLFYTLSGQKIWAVRLWLVLVKFVAVILCQRSVTRLTNRAYGTLAACGLTLLLGQPWQALQTAYAFITVIPLILATWQLLLAQSFERAHALDRSRGLWRSEPVRNACWAGALTSLALWTKLNAGVYLFVGGVFAILFRARVTRSLLPARQGEPARSRLRLGRVRLGFVIAASLLLGAYLSAHASVLYFAYLGAPLLLITATALHATVRARADADGELELRALTTYCGCTAGVSLLVLFGYYGPHGAFEYLRETAHMLGALHYERAFPELGAPLIYVGLNENYWLQLPWLASLLFIAWLLLERRWGPRAFGPAWRVRRAEAHCSFALSTLHCFVLYPRSDDMHLFQALLLVLPVLAVLLFQLEAFLRAWRPKSGPYARASVLAAAALYGCTIAVWPRLARVLPGTGDYANSRFQYLEYRPAENPYVRHSTGNVSERDWDRMIDDAGRYVASITVENEPILVLSDQRLLHAISHTTSVGGRYAFYFYLVSTGLLDRRGFNELVPRRVIQDIVDHPPRVIVSVDDHDPLLRAFPSLHALRDSEYVKTRVFRFVKVYELKSTERELALGEPGAH